MSRRLTGMKMNHFRTISTLVLIAVISAATTVHGQVGSPIACMAPELPIPTEYRFDGDVASEVREDRNRDGKTDAWETFERGIPKHYEFDRDFDGTAELRLDWELPADTKPSYFLRHRLALVNGRYRLIPFVPRSHPLPVELPNAIPFPFRTTKLVNGAWVDTFDDEVKYVPPPIYGPVGGIVKQPESRPVVWRYEQGKPVWAEQNWTDPKSYYRVEFRAGLPTLIVSRDVNGRSKTTYENGYQAVYELFDAAGQPTRRYTTVNGRQRSEEFQNGRWVDLSPPIPGEVVVNDPKTGKPKLRKRYAADGSYVEETLDAAGQPERRESFDPEGWPTTVEKLVAGKWTGDFEEQNPNYRESSTTYRDGRIVHTSNGRATSSSPLRTTERPTPRTEIWKHDGVPYLWYTYDENYPRLPRVAYEMRDLNEDGVPDLKIDYDRLTIEQPAVLPK